MHADFGQLLAFTFSYFLLSWLRQPHMNKEEESDLNIETQSNRTESQLKPIYSELVS